MNLKLRDYQYDAFKNIIFENKGRCIIPTGGGKTYLEATVLGYKSIINNNDIFLVLAPRIILLQQLVREYKYVLTKGNSIIKPDGNLLYKIKQQYRMLGFHSGEHEPEYSDDLNWEEFSTTSLEKALEEYEKSKKCNQKFIIFSTYHSCHKLKNIIFDTIISDESQYLVQEGFYEDFNTLKSDNKFFFTATEKRTKSKESRGLNNEKVYGKILYQISPKELVEKGYIVPIKLHIAEFDTIDREQTFLYELKEIVDKNIFLNNKLTDHKLLIAAPGTKYIKKIEDNIDILKTFFPKFTIFTITSKNGSKVNGINISRSREEFLKQLNIEKNALVFHYDILSEGIDISGFSGALTLRNLHKIKFLQTIGRTVRLSPNKEFSVISIPVINDDTEEKEYVLDIIDQLESEGFDINFEEIEFTNKNDLGIKDEENLEDAYIKSKKDKNKELEEEIKHFIYERKVLRKIDEIEKTKSLSDLNKIYDELELI